MSEHTASPSLDRALNLPLLILFGVGTMVGAGIYVLVGEIIGVTGALAPWSFAVAAVVAAFTAKSYGELAAHYPLSAGEAVYVERAFASGWLTALTGWAVVVTGLVSAATLANGFAGYLTIFFAGIDTVAVGAYVFLLGLVAAWGIRATAWVAGTITVASVAGLLLVLAVSGEHFARLPEVWPDLLLPASFDASALAIVLGGFIAFYAFVGFEDMVNVAEETRDPARNMPRAIAWALLIAAALYILVALAAVLANYRMNLANHPAPLAAMVAGAGEHWPALIASFSILSVTNSALAQIVMASRVLYGMANQGRAPSLLGTVHPVRQTPLNATVLTTMLILGLALWFPLITLAKATSFVILCVFALMNLALLRLKHTGAVRRQGWWVPACGAGLSLALLAIASV